jgi:hypothetical protein
MLFVGKNKPARSRGIQMTPEQMIEHALVGNGDGTMWIELCGAFQKGFPIENLRRLLVSEDDRVSSGAAFLANELGKMMRPFIDELVALASHTDAQARSDVLYALSHCAGPADLDALSRIMLAFDDPEPFVHRSAMMFVIMADDRSLASAITEAARRFPGSPFERILSILLGRRDRLYLPWEQIDAAKLSEFINCEEAVVRRFGVGLAARPKPVVDVGFLEIARVCGDTEGIGMIDSIMRSPKPTNARLARIEYVESES